jgi:SAM-dependent methyltransferase
MNENHLQYLASPEWARRLRTELLPWVEALGDLGDDVLEIGPGPGLTTDLLRDRVAVLTAVEIDADLAASLEARLAGTNVTVICADATQTGLPPDQFSTATCFSVLHHVPGADLQDQVLAEIHRLLRPGGRLVAVDALDIPTVRSAHVDDIFCPLDQATLADRLAAAGFTDVSVEPGDYQVHFHATKPA